jgi:hypothetical protein
VVLDEFLPDEELVLTLDLEPGENADAVIAAESLIAWVAAIREAGAVMDPSGRVVVDLISADASCLRLRALVRFVEDQVLGSPADALNEFPRIKKIVVATVLGVTSGLALAGTAALVMPNQTVNLSEAGIKRLREEQAKVRHDPHVQAKVQTFYKTVSRDRHVTNVSTSEGVGKPVLLSVPRSEFNERSGLWAMEEPANHERPAEDVWNVVVTYPAMKSQPLSWGFERDGLPFTARMEDQTFLAAVKSGTLPIVVQEGVQMVVEVHWTERFDGQVWEAVPRTRKIKRVLSPRPRTAPPGVLPLFRNN